MFTPAPQDPLIASIRSVLAPLPIHDDTHLVQRHGQKQASVLMPLVHRGTQWEVLFTRRPQHMKSHAGQISFPGGKIEPGEKPCDGALRETHEEVGVAATDIDMLGRLPSFNAADKYRITPYVGVINPDAAIIPEAGEVDEVFEVPFSFLMEPNNHVRRDLEINGEPHIFYDMPWPKKQDPSHHIWGMTAMMIYRLYDKLYPDPDREVARL